MMKNTKIVAQKAMQKVMRKINDEKNVKNK